MDFITNIRQFRAAARHSPDLSQDTDPDVRVHYDPSDFIGDRCPAGMVYPASLVIEDWAHAPLNGHRYYLVIANIEWLSNDLAELEAHLFDYYLTECTN